jgi:predicted dehydrogenase
MQERILNFGMVGCGRVSENHLAALTSGIIPARLVAVADLDETRARSKGEKYRVPHYASHHDLLRAHPEIDVVCVATPTGYHAENVVELARYGKHIVVEKPMALSVADCDAMIRACRKGGGRLFVVKQNRFNPAVVAARKALEAGRFGKMVMASVRVRWCRHQSYYENDHWHGTWELDGGVMSQQASHHLDLLQWFMGPIENLQCRTATRLLDIEVEDTAVATFQFKSGALGVFQATVATRPTDLEGSLSLLGEKGSVVIGGMAVNKVVHWKFDPALPEDQEMHHHHSQEVPNVYGKGHLPYLANVIEAISKDKPALVEAAEGRKNVQILTALYESAARHSTLVKPGCRILRSRLGKPGHHSKPGKGRHHRPGPERGLQPVSTR